jgi:MYXO-CTERM domain-containing protein
VQNNVAWGNKASGFYANHSAGGNTWYNNTSFQNGTQYNMLASSWDSADNRTDGVTLSGAKAHILRNNIGFPNKNQYMDASYGVDSQFNTWDLNITPKVSDFLSTTDPSVSGTGATIETTSPALGPRQADGSLPNVDFMKLAAGSQMIDKGTNVQLPFVGAAPDLGAYEYGATGGTPTGGATAAGGTTATGGATGAGGATTPTGGATTATGGKTGGGGATTATGGATTPTGGATTPAGGTTTATGGKTGGGGATTATGGKTGGGGSTGAGGATVVGGAPGTGGNTGAAGVAETGGTSGVVDTGGTVETGGSVVSGGQVATGGVPGSAGATAPFETGGAAVTGGASQPASTGGTTATTEATGTSSGCSCRMAGRPGTGSAGFALLGLVALALRLRRRR